MDAKAEVKVTGRVEVFMNDELRDVKNLVVDVGKEWVAGMMTGAGSVMSHMGVGVGTTVAAGSQTALVSPLLRSSLAVAGGTLTANTVMYSCTYANGEAEGALTEAGIFDQASGGIMLARTVFDEINKGSGDVMTIIWTITVA